MNAQWPERPCVAPAECLRPRSNSSIRIGAWRVDAAREQIQRRQHNQSSAWMVFGYSEVRQVLLDTDTFSLERTLKPDGSVDEILGAGMLGLDPLRAPALTIAGRSSLYAQWGLDRPGMKDMALALHADYGSNLEHYAEWQAYFLKYQPPALVTWGRNDFIFTVDGATAYRRDIPKAEVHILETGHFALETSAGEIATAIGRFLPQHVQNNRRSA